MLSTRLLPLVLAAACLGASLAAPADETAHRQEVDTLFRLTQMEQKVRESLDNLLVLQLRQNPDLAAHQSTVRDFLERHIGWEALKGDLEGMYLQAFSEAELKEMNAFYITPVGQKVLNRVPELVQERNRLAAQRLQEHIDELQEELQKAAESR